MTTWRNTITDYLEGNDTIKDLEITLTDKELDVEFDDEYGSVEGKPFYAWSKDYVYFPVCYDGAESVGAMPRNPSKDEPVHYGGG